MSTTNSEDPSETPVLVETEENLASITVEGEDHGEAHLEGSERSDMEKSGGEPYGEEMEELGEQFVEDSEDEEQESKEQEQELDEEELELGEEKQELGEEEQELKEEEQELGEEEQELGEEEQELKEEEQELKEEEQELKEEEQELGEEEQELKEEEQELGEEESELKEEVQESEKEEHESEDREISDVYREIEELEFAGAVPSDNTLELQRLTRSFTFLDIEQLKGIIGSMRPSREEDREWMSSLMPGIEENEEEEEEIPVREGVLPPPQVMVLEADNPLMKRFQDALKGHLNRQLEKLKSQIRELEGELKLKTSDKSTMGEMIYSETQLIRQQLGTIQEYRKTMAQIAEQKDKVDKELAVERKRLKDTTLELRKTKKRDESLKLEFEALTDIVKQMEDYEKAQSAELSLSKHQSEGNKKAKQRLAIEKQQQDYILWRLSKEVMRLSNEYRTVQQNAEDELVKCNEVSQLLADAEVDLKGLMAENKIISNAIALAFVTLEKKDMAYSDLRESYEEAVQHWQSLCKKLKSYENTLELEMKRNRLLNEEKLRMDYQVDTAERKKRHLKSRISTMSNEVTRVEQMIELTQEDYDQAVASNHKLQKSLSVVTQEYDILHKERSDCEMLIFNKCQERITSNLVFENLKKQIKKIGEENAIKEETLVSVENQLARSLLSIQKGKTSYSQKELIIAQLRESVGESELKLKLTKDGLKNLEGQRNSLMNQAAAQKAKLLKLKEDQKKGYIEAPIEKRIKEKKETLNKCVKELKTLQEEWLNAQNELVSCNENRSKQLLEINIRKKHLLVSLDKASRLDSEIKALMNQEKRASRDMVTCHSTLQNVEIMAYQKHEQSQLMAEKTRDVQNECAYLLKKEEESIMDLQREVRELEESNRDDSLAITELQREYLSWDKKYQLAVETKENIEKERAVYGEIGLMKQEIHRMEVRYAHLRKAQEKLIQDLEMCVARRDGIVDVAFAREMRASKGEVSYTRHQFIKKIDELKNKLKKSMQNVKDAEKQIEELRSEKKQLTENYETKQEQLDALKSGINQLENQLFEGQIHKHKNLELIVRRQRKCRFLEDVKANKYRLLFKNEKGIEIEEEKQEKLHSDLTEIVDRLMSDFPNLKLQLLQIQNTLKVSVDV